MYIELLGKADSGKVLNLVTVERLLEFHTYQWERYWRVLLPACSEAAGKKIMTTCVIVDLAGAFDKLYLYT